MFPFSKFDGFVIPIENHVGAIGHYKNLQIVAVGFVLFSARLLFIYLIDEKVPHYVLSSVYLS